MLWTIRKFAGGSELGLRIKITLDQPVTAAHKREVRLDDILYASDDVCVVLLGRSNCYVVRNPDLQCVEVDCPLLENI